MYMGFPCGSAGKEPTCNVGDLGLIPGLGRLPGEGNGNPPLVYLTREFHVQKSLACYSPWDCRESHTIELLTL